MKHQNLTGQKVNSFNFLKVLGEGAWAIVYQAMDDTTNQIVAIKVIPKILIKQTPKLEQLVKTEINVLKQCKNDNVIRFVKNMMTEKSILIAMEYCNGGDLEHYLQKKKRLTEDEATAFLKQIINGFKGLHEVNAMHRDFKVANVLLHQGICKIADLGFAKQMEKQKLTGTILGTSLTMAPEVLEEKPYGRQADIWSLGVVYYQLLYGKYPYYGINDFDILKKIKNSKPDFSDVNISAKAKDFIEKCLTVDPKKRINWLQIYEHALIQKNDEKLIYNLKSRINVVGNKNFYQKNEYKGNEDLMYLDKKKEINKNFTEFEEAVVRESVNIEGMMKKNEEKKKISAAIEKYQKIYLNRRNNIMFIFKFITPHIFSLYAINANHGITMFVMSKKSYHDMKEYFQHMVKKVNFLNLKPYFEDFVKSSSYEQLVQTAKSDMDIIIAQIESYKEDIGVCNNEIKAEFEISKISSSNWDKLVDETIDSYEFQLGENLDAAHGEQKVDLIKVIEALTYYRKNSQNANIEEFDKMMECFNFGMAETQIKKNISSKLSGYE